MNNNIIFNNMLNYQYLYENKLLNENIIKIFNETFYDLSFDDLKRQRNNILTDDSCIHYLHKNNQIYSWNYNKKEWIQFDIKYQYKLFDLF